MRVTSFLFLCAVAFLMLRAEADDLFVVQLVREVPALKKDEIYDGSRTWIAESFKSAKSVIEHADKESGVIIGNGAVDITSGPSFLPLNTKFTFKIKEEIKDGRFRLTFTNVAMFTDGYEKPIESTNRSMNEPKLQERFSQIADSLADRLKQKPKDNW